MAEACAAADAVVGLPFGGYSPVVSQQESPAELTVILSTAVGYECPVGNRAVIVMEDSGYVYPIGARHAVFAGSAVYHGIFLHQDCHFLHQGQFLVVHGLEMAECLHVLLQGIHRCHPAQDTQDPGPGTHEPEGPPCGRPVGFKRLKPGGDVGGDICQTSAEKRLHHHYGDIPFDKFGIQVVGVDIALAVGMGPVHIIHLYLAEIPVVGPVVVKRHEIVEGILVPVERKTQVADPSGGLLGIQELHDSVVHIPALKCLPASSADGVEEVVVEIFRPELAKGVPVHFNGCLR